jgi:hypothetical protein
VTGFGQVLLRTFIDQTCMCPFGLALFFTFMTIAEGGGQKALKRKFSEVQPSPPFHILIEGIFAYFEDELLYLACGADYQF